MTDSPVDMNNEQIQEASRIAALITAYMQKTLDRAGHDELDTWVSADKKNMLLFEELTDERKREEATQWMNDVNTMQALQKVKNKITFKKRPATHIKLWQYVVAACVLIAIALLMQRWYGRPNQSVNPKQQELVEKPVIKPGGNKATLTLQDGTSIVLAEMNNGTLKDEQGTLIDKKKEGEIIYHAPADDSKTDKQAYNTLTTPRGGEYMLTLSDGSKVWLNASSSIRYPVAINNNTRKVYLTGEAYFEVAKDPSRPFVVAIDKNDAVEVLGTHFNIMSYDDEETLEITLAEGSVKVNKDQVLKPGQQYAQNKATGKAQVLNHVDLQQALAWKNGFFSFSGTPIRTIMREFARWYDIDVTYDGNIENSDFTATVSRKDDISTILSRFEKTGTIHFKTEGKKITVTP